MNSLTITPHGPLRGTIQVPGDKSITHRALIVSALAEGSSTITGYCHGEDCLNTLRALQALGVSIQVESDRVLVSGKGLSGLIEPEQPLDCGNSGTGLRLLAGVLAGQSFCSILTGDASLRSRPMGRIVNPLRMMGATIQGRKGGALAPLAIQGGALKGITYHSPVSSAQIKSAVLLAGLCAEGETRFSEPLPSRDHTERLFRSLGIPCEVEGQTLVLSGHPTFAANDLVVPGDVSAAAFFIVGASLVPDSEITIVNVGLNPARTGILEVLGEMGADIRILNRRDQGGEPVGDLVVRHAPLRGISITSDQVPTMIDEFPIFCVAAALAEGETTVTGAEELRVKETDRIHTMATELMKLNVAVQETPDGFILQGRANVRGGPCLSHGDHRVAMALAIAALTGDAPITIHDTDCIATSYPQFHDNLLDLLTFSHEILFYNTHPCPFTSTEREFVGKATSVKTDMCVHPRHRQTQRQGLVVTIDGPAGAGKSTVARVLALRLGYAYFDTGALYRAIAWGVHQAGIDCRDTSAMEAFLASTDVRVSLEEGVTRTIMDNEDVTAHLRASEMSRLASTVAALPQVRERLLPIQRRYGRRGGIVAEGRDIGTRVFPDAEVKFFLEADLETRTARRYRERVQVGSPETSGEIRRQIQERDANDRSRDVAPLRPAADAVVIDSSSLTVDQVVERLMKWIPVRP